MCSSSSAAFSKAGYRSIGQKQATTEGVPQGGPLSPVLANVVLDELDWALERRGHRFARYADDCNIFVKSKRAGERLMQNVTRYLSDSLRLTAVDAMNEFKILANEYLSKNTVAFYNVPYTRMGSPGNPDFLNALKNTFNNFPEHKLQSAVRELRGVLESDLPKIFRRLKFDAMTLCVVPRAKAEDTYHANQQLFRATVQATIRQVNGIVDGTNYMRRHANTRTTHLRNPVPNYNNDGPLPYPGITEETCEISPSVRGKNILLVDDIYTPGVNIDEDAINALLRAGARTVTFYAVGKV